MKIPDAKAAVEKEEGTRENTSMAADESQKQERSDRWSKEWGQNSAFCVIHGSLSSLEFGVGTTISEIQRSSGTPRWYCKRRFWVLCSIHRTRIISITNDSSKSRGYHVQTARVRRTSSRCSVSLHPCQNGRCTDVIENSKVRLSTYLDTSTKTQMA